MKRILTLAIAAMLVVAFAIPAFAAPKVELVGAEASLQWDFNATTPWGVQTDATSAWLKFKISADNFVLNTEIVPGLLSSFLGDYDFSLALPYMAFSGLWNDYTASFGYHGGREVRLASDEKFAEMAGFNWAVYLNDDGVVAWAPGGQIQSAHAQISVPVGENFTGSLNYAHEFSYTDTVDPLSPLHNGEYDLGEEIEIHMGYLDLSYTISEGLSVSTQIAKNLDSATNDFFGAVTVNFPIVEGFTGAFFADYGMVGFLPDTDFLNYGSYNNGYATDNVESYLDFNYANENAHAEFLVDYMNDSAFSDRGDFFAVAEYASNAKNSIWSSNNRRALYADVTDGFGRGWNSQYKWVRNNNGNNYAVRGQGSFNADNSWNARAYAMFAPELIPVVLTARGNYVSDGTWDFRNWVGIRLNEDIHLALYDRYVYDGTAGEFDLDAALVYNRDNLTASVTGTELTDGWGVELYLGIEF